MTAYLQLLNRHVQVTEAGGLQSEWSATGKRSPGSPVRSGGSALRVELAVTRVCGLCFRRKNQQLQLAEAHPTRSNSSQRRKAVKAEEAGLNSPVGAGALEPFPPSSTPFPSSLHSSPASFSPPPLLSLFSPAPSSIILPPIVCVCGREHQGPHPLPLCYFLRQVSRRLSPPGVEASEQRSEGQQETGPQHPHHAHQ